MREVSIGDFVETIHGVNGILTAMKNTCHGSTAFIAIADGRTFYYPITDFTNCKYMEG